MANPITFYDIPSTHPDVIWSPNSSRSRFLMNYLDVPYQVEWVNYDTLKPLFDSYGVPKNPTHPPYWVPTIKLADGSFVTASTGVLDYFLKTHKEKIYPDDAYQKFSEHFVQWFGLEGNTKLTPLLFFVTLAFTENILTTEGSKKYFRETKGASLIGKELDACRNDAEGIAAHKKDAYEFIQTMREEYPGYEGFDRSRFMTGKYLYGDKLTYADIIAAATFFWVIRVSEGQENHYFEWPANTEWLQTWYKTVMNDARNK